MRIDSVYGVKSSSVADIFEAGKRGELDYSAILKSKKEELKSKIENGDWDSLSDLRLIARALEVPIEELVREEAESSDVK